MEHLVQALVNRPSLNGRPFFSATLAETFIVLSTFRAYRHAYVGRTTQSMMNFPWSIVHLVSQPFPSENIRLRTLWFTFLQWKWNLFIISTDPVTDQLSKLLSKLFLSCAACCRATSRSTRFSFSILRSFSGHKSAFGVNAASFATFWYSYRRYVNDKALLLSKE